MKRRLASAGTTSNDFVFGRFDSGRLKRDRLLARPPAGATEIYLHPATRRWTAPDAPPAAADPESEYAALLGRDVVAAANRPGIRRARFSALRERAAA
jgi:hypothetical protein